MRVLVACEFSGTVRDAFIRRGHDAMSCDLLPTEVPGPHHQGDALELLKSREFDLVVAHPPCTFLTNSGVRWLYSDQTRWQSLIDGAVFFRDILATRVERVAVENPVMHGWAKKIVGAGPTQIVQPWMFGHLESKGIGLWLKGLPPLVETDNVREEMKRLPKSETHRVHHMAPGVDRWKERSRFFTGVAEAMADQWGEGV